VTGGVVAVFDLDGTIAKQQTFLPFLRGLSAGRTAVGLAVASPWMAWSLWDRDRRDEAKERLLGVALRSLVVADVGAAADQFADSLVSGGLTPEVIERVDHHRSSGHRLVIASASPEFVVEPIARRLGFDDVIATRLEVVDGYYTGRYDGLNVRAGEKLRRVIETFGRTPDYAYGNLPDDGPLLAAAVMGFVVKRGRIAQYSQRSP
jgi:phosphatidylglycerophosphatase C